MSKLITVVGGQFGSEAKGHVTARIVADCLTEAPSVAVVRVAGPNAGHTAYDDNGVAHAFRQIPVGVVIPPLGQPSQVEAMIAAGSEIDLPVLLDEIQHCKDEGIYLRLVVDPEATMITDRDKDAEVGIMASESETNLVKRIGSTGKGVGAARASRLMREPKRRLCDDPKAMRALTATGAVILDVANLLRMTQPRFIVIEGTQGYGLGLRAGFYPQCTSSDCRAIDFQAMLGISPTEGWISSSEIWVVARVYPIRVAGNSGPLKDETTWEELGLPEEKTTVTKKIRRVGGEDWGLVADAVVANGGHDGGVYLAVTMVDQKFPDMKGTQFSPDITEECRAWMKYIESVTRAPIGMLTTSPDTGIWLGAAWKYGGRDK